MKNSLYNEEDNIALTKKLQETFFKKEYFVDYSKYEEESKKWTSEKVNHHINIGDTSITKDPLKATERGENGYTGEKSLELWLNCRFMDYVISHSKNHNEPDLWRYLKIACGVKTAKVGRFPVISIHEKFPQVIVMTSIKKPQACICGLAYPPFKDQVDISLVYDNNIVEKKKYGFFAFESLIKFKTLEELRELCKDYTYG